MVGGVVMAARTPPNELVQAEAAAWLVRLQRDDRGEADENAFRSWLAADMSHAIAFEAVSEAWDVTGVLQRDLRGSDHRARTSSRRSILAGAAVLVTAGGSLALWRASEAGAYQTEVGEQKHVSLDDGTRIFLDTDTRLKIRLSETARSAELQYGRANFQVTSDPARPFVVNVATSRIVAGASNLDVTCDGDLISVVLVQGSADILRPNTQPEKIVSGERFVIHPNSAGLLDRPAMTPLLAWQTGRAIFEDRKLSEAISELNRYSVVKLAVSDPRTAALRVSGIYRVGDNIGFATSVSKLLPVRIVRAEGRINLMPDRSRALKNSI
jgi:transmembrane sensor